ncbi:MAG: endonuclease/exonuclease/phosphatase family protein [Bacteroidales bacterium]|jgi:predicted extracellular nuclease|nr:endonuclease/exonuclease/phosphatase family protein [Bacteroidales bacterium]
MYNNIKTIKAGTFNLMNLMMPNREMYGGSLKYTPEEFHRKIAWTSSMLKQMDADVIGFQECFHKQALSIAVSDIKKYQNAEIIMGDEIGNQPRVALMSVFPIDDVEIFDKYPPEAVIDFRPKNSYEKICLPFDSFSRPVLKADIFIKPFGIVTFFVVHLKSKRPVFYDGEDERNPIDLARAQVRALMIRASESAALRAILVRSLKNQNRPVVVFGDVNDTGNAVTTRIISGEVPQHRLPDSQKRSVWDVLLYHVKDIQARRSYQDFYYTHIHNGMYESLDHIMVSEELVTENPKNVGRVGLVSVYNDHLVDQTFTVEKQDKCKSDHGTVVCTLELNAEKSAYYQGQKRNFYKNRKK